MNTLPLCAPAESRYELRFISLFNRGRGFSFPCDADGRVAIDQLSERGRVNYFYARVVVGFELSGPTVVPAA